MSASGLDRPRLGPLIVVLGHWWRGGAIGAGIALGGLVSWEPTNARIARLGGFALLRLALGA